jgi:hypothetical protein
MFFTGANAPAKSKTISKSIDGVTTLTIDGKKIVVEIASSPETREKGLMFRKSLPENQGMLFIFDYPQQVNFWMKNTFIPLDIAFINAKGVITEIRQMKPHDLTPVESKSNEVFYVIEANVGWFAKNKLSAGMKVKGLP